MNSNTTKRRYKPYDVVVFKITKEGKVLGYDEGTNCNAMECFCKESSVLDNIEKYCVALLTAAECRSRMCAHTLQALKEETFGVNFSWMEIGELKEGLSDNEDDEEIDTSNSNDVSQKPNVSNASPSVSERKVMSLPSPMTELFQRTKEGKSQELPDVTSTTSGDLNSSSESANTASQADSSAKTFQQHSGNVGSNPDPKNSTPKKSSKSKSTVSALILKKPILTVSQSKASTSTSSADQEQSVSQKQVEEAAPVTNIVISNISTNEPEQSITSAADISMECETGPPTEESEAASEMEVENSVAEPDPVELDTTSEQEFSPTETGTIITEIDAAAAVFAVPNIPIECTSTASGLSITLVNSKSLTRDTATDIPMQERPTVQTAKTSESNDGSLTTKPVENILIRPVAIVEPKVSSKRPASPLSSSELLTAQPSLKSKDLSEITDLDLPVDVANAISLEPVYETSQSIFETTGGAARVRGRLGNSRSRKSSNASLETAPLLGQTEKELSDAGEGIEKGLPKDNEPAQDCSNENEGDVSPEEQLVGSRLNTASSSSRDRKSIDDKGTEKDGGDVPEQQLSRSRPSTLSASSTNRSRKSIDDKGTEKHGGDVPEQQHSRSRPSTPAASTSDRGRKSIDDKGAEKHDGDVPEQQHSRSRPSTPVSSSSDRGGKSIDDMDTEDHSVDVPEKQLSRPSTPACSSSDRGRKSIDEMDTDKHDDSTPTNSLRHKGGVTTRSRSNRPAPASVKRQRADRTAKQTAQAKITSTFVYTSSSESSASPVKGGGSAPTEHVGKRLRSSDSVQKLQSQSVASSINKNKRRQMDSLGSEQTNSDTPSISSRSSTPTYDEHGEEEAEDVRNLRSSTVKDDNQSSSNVTANQEKDSTSKTPGIVREVDSASSTDSSESDSGESQFSHVSEIPLAVRMRKKERKKRRMEEKLASPGMAHIARLEKKRKKKRHQLLLNTGTSSTSKKGRFTLEHAQALVEKLKKDKLANKAEQTKPKEKKAVEDDEEVQMIGESPNTGALKSSRTEKQLFGENGANPSKSTRKGIHISFKDKAKSLQRSSSSPGTSLLETSANSAESGNHSVQKTFLAKSKSVPVPDSPPSHEGTSVLQTAENDVELEDGNSWQFGGISSPRKAHQIARGLVGPNAESTVPPESKSANQSQLDKVQQQKGLPKPTMSEKHRSTPSADRPLWSDKDKITPNSGSMGPPLTSGKSNDASQSSRHLRTRKQIFDPKMEAIKINPRPVPKVTKETLQQKQQNTPLPLSAKPKETSGDKQSAIALSDQREKVMPTKSTTETTQQKSQNSQQKSQNQTRYQELSKEADDIIEVLSQPNNNNKEPVAGSSRQSPEKSQTSPKSPPDKQKNTDEPEVITVRTPNSKESPIQGSKPQSPMNKSPQKAPNPPQASKPQTSHLSFVDGEIRVLPRSSSSGNISTTTTSSGDSGRGSSSGGGSWRRGDSESRRVPFEDDTVSVDFETPPDEDDNDSRHRNNNRNRNRNRDRGAGGFRGRGNHHNRGGHQQYGGYPGGDFIQRSPPPHGYFNGPRGQGPRPPFRGGPPQGHLPPYPHRWPRYRM